MEWCNVRESKRLSYVTFRVLRERNRDGHIEINDDEYKLTTKRDFVLYEPLLLLR